MPARLRVFQGRRSLWQDALYLIPAFAAVYFLWNTVELRILIYPLRLLVTFIHETGHALIAILTGGHLMEFVVNGDGSGYVSVRGGNPLWITPAGYLGAALFGCGLIWSINRFRSTRLLAFGLGFATVIFSLLLLYFDRFAPNAWQGDNSQLAILIGTATGGGLMLIAWLTHPRLLRWLLLVLALSCSLEAVLDIRYLADSSDQLGPKLDIHNFAELVPIFDATVWAYIWIIIALVAFFVALRFSYNLRLSQE